MQTHEEIVKDSRANIARSQQRLGYRILEPFEQIEATDELWWTAQHRWVPVTQNYLDHCKDEQRHVHPKADAVFRRKVEES